MAGTYFDFPNTPIESDITLKAKWCCGEEPDDPTQPAEFVLEAVQTGYVGINNRWSAPILVNSTELSSTASTSLYLTQGQQFTVKEKNPGVFRTWTSMPGGWTGTTKVKIVSMPKMNRFTEDEAGTKAGDYFFLAFNSGGTIVSYPEGAFDTSKITTFGAYCFRYFNRQNQYISSLPAGSFNFNAATSVGNYFCQNFNREATGLATLPAGSFNFPNLVTAGSNMFASFNLTGSINDLPDGSFQFPKMTYVGGGFGYYFNAAGKITQLPKNSFDLSAVSTAGGTVFDAFNGVSGQLGQLARDNTSYTNSRNISSQNTTAYYYPSGSETVPPGGQFHWKMKTT